MDFKHKYLKYKAKYLSLKNIIGGQDQDCDFSDASKYTEIGRGQDGIVYKDNTNTYAYKVINIVKPKDIGAWGKKLKLGGSGMTEANFNISVSKYMEASRLGLGPTFYNNYLCPDKNIGVIVTQYIKGITIKKAIDIGRFNLENPDDKKRLDDLIHNLRSNGIIPAENLADTHCENFMLEDRTNRIYGIDF